MKTFTIELDDYDIHTLIILSLLLGLVIALNILMILTASCETIDESIIITINNSTDWRTNLSTCCDWMG